MTRRIAVVLAVCTAITYAAVLPRSHAEIDADAGSENGITLCDKLYSTGGHDPSGLWSRLNSKATPPIKIITTDVPPDGTGTKTRNDDNGIQIFWDPTRDVSKDGITATPCEVLYHELQHAADDADNVPDSTLDDACPKPDAKGDGGIPYAEWRAVAAENAYRASWGLPPRTSYNGTDFPPGSFEDCKKNPPPPGPTNKPKPTNSVFGDPHLATTDGLLYDLQQVGEFTAFTSGDGTAPRVQIRTAPVGDSKTASLVSAAAAGNANQRIAFISKNSVLTISHTDGTDTETVTIDDGAQRDLGAGMTLTAAASTDFTGRGYTVHWAEGSQLQVNDAGWWGLLVSFEPSGAAKAAQPRGLLGNFNGDPADDLIRPDGRRVATEASPATIRSDFGDAWRISQADSLFPYSAGESTASFTDRAFPSGEPQLAGTDQARTVCQRAGVTSAELLAACVLDVTVTGSPVLADVAAAVARDVRIKNVAGHGQGVGGTDFGAGRTVSGTVSAAKQVTYRFTGHAGEVANIRSECTPSGKGFTYGVGAIDSSGRLGEPVGRDDGCMSLGRVAFATTATYQLVIIGDGQYRISWQSTPGDQQRPLSLTAPNTGHVAAATRHHLRFTVNPGQQWTFTPAGGCSQVPGFTWQIIAADGSSGGRGIYDGCQPMGPLALTPGDYDVQIDAQSADADYQFTARSS